MDRPGYFIEQIYDSSAVYLKFLILGRRLWCRNFK